MRRFWIGDIFAELTSNKGKIRTCKTKIEKLTNDATIIDAVVSLAARMQSDPTGGVKSCDNFRSAAAGVAQNREESMPVELRIEEISLV